MAHSISISKLGERVLRTLNSGKNTVEQKVKQQDAELAVAQARDNILFKYFIERKNSGDFYFPEDTLVQKSFTVTKTKKGYSGSLPTRYLPLVSSLSGISTLYPSESPEIEILSASMNHERLFLNQPAFSMEGNPYYTLFQQNVNVFNFEGGDECELIAWYVQAGEDFDPDEFLAIPPELQEDVVMEALQILNTQKQYVEDRFTDAREA